jgi:hypothetical protein
MKHLMDYVHKYVLKIKGTYFRQKYRLTLGLIRGKNLKNHFFLLHPKLKLYNKDTPCRILYLYIPGFTRFTYYIYVVCSDVNVSKNVSLHIHQHMYAGMHVCL